MRTSIVALLLNLISLIVFSQDFFHWYDVKNQIKEDIDYSYLDEDYLKKGINKELAFAKATKAMDRMYRGDFIEAYKDIKQVIELDPESDYPFVLKGLCCIELDSIPQSKKAFERANQIDDQNEITIFYLGYISRIVNEYDKAKEYYKSLIKKDKRSFLGYYGLGNMYFSLGKFLNAKQYYTKAVKINPDFYEGFYNIGIIELLYHEPKNAIKYFQSAIAANKEFSSAYHILGLIYYYNDEETKAKEYWDKAIELKPDKPLYLLSRGVWYLNNDDIDNGYNEIVHMINVTSGETYLFSDFGDFNDEKVKNTVKQLVVFDKNIHLVEDTIKPMLKWYLCYSIYGYYKYAKEKIDEAYKIDSSGSLINYFKGNEYENYMYYPEAISYYERSLDKDPFIAETYLKLGILHFRQKKYDESINYITTFLNHNDTAKIAYRCRGTSYMKNKKFNEALKDFEIFIKKDSTDFDILFNKAMCHKELGQFTESIKTFQRVIENNSDSYESYYFCAQCRYKVKDFDNALSDLDSIPDDYLNKNPEIYHLKGRIKAQLKLYNEAISDFTSGLKQDSDNIDLLSERGKLYYFIGDNNNAFIDYSKLIQLDPEIAAAYYVRGVILVKLKRFSEACSDFKTAESKGYVVPRNAFAICNLNIKD